jgi:superfamily II DNA or RNA helicase
MLEARAATYHAGQRVRIRGEVWDVDAMPDEADGTQVLPLRNVLDPVRTIKVIANVEEIEALPQARLPGMPSSYERWRDFHGALLCTMKPPPGMLGGLDQAKIAGEDYQLVPVIRAFERPLQRILIADDVGLGKTIEAILILLELHARGRGDRVLVVCPAGLQDQWADELRDKAGLEFEIFDSKHVLEIRQQGYIGQNPWTARRRIIASVDYLKRHDIKRALRDVPWDLIIADEAHYLAETSSAGRAYRTERSRFAQFVAGQSDSLVLLTATPHTGDPRSLYSLIDLLDPSLVASPDQMSREKVAPVLVRRYKRDILDAEGRSRFKDIHVQSVPVPFADERERKLYDAVVKYCRRRWKRERDNAVGFAMTVIKKRLISSRYALVETLEERLKTLAAEPLDLDTKRGVLADYRAGAPLTEAQQVEAERQVMAAPPGDAGDRSKERAEVQRLLRMARDVPAEIDSKANRLLGELHALNEGSATGTPEKVIVFTEFRDTHDFLQRFLSDDCYAYRIATLTGAMSREERSKQIEQFSQADTMLLLATDAASEGLNLQEHCRTIIHYELPWNPNRLEQRNGRVHRWGQTRDVLVRNLIYDETYDAHILQVLMEKTDRIRKQLGSASDVIGVMSSISWEELLMSAGGVAPEDAPAVERVEEQVAKAVRTQTDHLLAWRDRELGPTRSFDAAATEQVKEYRHRGASRRLDAQRRRSIVRWMVPLFGGRVEERANGTVTIDVPQSLRQDLTQRIDAATFSYEMLELNHKDVAVLGMHHPLLTACGTAARTALYDGTSMLGTARLTAKLAAVPRSGILYTFAVRYTLGDGTTFTEEIVPVFTAVDGSVSRSAQSDEALFDAAPLSGALSANDPRLLEPETVEARAKDAATEAIRRARERARAFEEGEAKRAQTMLAEVDAWAIAKRAWLETQLAAPQAQMLLELDETHTREERGERELFERQRRRLRQQLETLDVTARERREKLERRSHVLPPTAVDLIGACLIVSA